MTDTLLQKLEEKMMMLLTEVESLRNEIHRLRHDNAALKAEQGHHTKKLQGLLSLLDSLDAPSSLLAHELGMPKGQEEYATA